MPATSAIRQEQDGADFFMAASGNARESSCADSMPLMPAIPASEVCGHIAAKRLTFPACAKPFEGLPGCCWPMLCDAVSGQSTDAKRRADPALLNPENYVGVLKCADCHEKPNALRRANSNTAW